ncbi:MAG: hypothetical protein HXY20_09810 [Acidobacteria bacterium]|nr:hypothetical protein [Acidobacteriota bacterium]
MPGIFGFLKTRITVDNRELIASMAQALEREGRYRVDLYHTDTLGLGRVSLGLMNPEPQPVWNEDRTLCALMEGELYDTDALRQGLIERGHRFSIDSDAELVLHSYEEFGGEFAVRLNGAFAVSIWSPGEKKLLLANDRLGLFPLYYAWTDRGFLFSSAVRALMADPVLPRRVDPVAVNEFLVFDHVLDDRTLLDAVRLLPQASTLSLQDGRLEIRPYWRLRYPQVYQPRSEQAYAEELLCHLRRAVRRRQPHGRPAGVLLSGGLDSRILVALLCEESPRGRLHTFTWGTPGCDDARFAREVAARCGARHHFYELTPDWLLRLADRAVCLTDGLGNIVNLHALAALEEEARHAEILYKGFMGDAMMGFAVRREMWGDYPPEIRSQVHLQAHEDMGAINYRADEQEQLFTIDFRRQVGDAVIRAYQDGLARAGVDQLTNQRLYFDLTQRVPRMTLNGVEVVRSRTIVRLPFTDNDLLDFVLTVPPGYLMERHLMKEVFIRFLPELAKIPLTPSGLPMFSCARHLRVQARQMAAWHLRRAGLGWLCGPDSRPYKDYGNWFRTTLRSWVMDTLLSERALQRGYFNADYVRRLVTDHMSGANHAVRIGALMTLELWHRQFTD